MRKSGTLVSVLRYRFVRVYLILNNVVLNIQGRYHDY